MGTKVGEPVYVETIFHDVKRGKELAQVYYAEVNGEPTIGHFYDAGQLPDNIVDTQKKFILDAVMAYTEALNN